MKNFLENHFDTIFLIISSTLAVLYFSWDINSWKFSFVGDEWHFYAYAKKIVQQDFLVNPFQLQGVHEQNSVMGSVYQAFFLWMFGFTNAAWRLSNIILIIPSSIFFFLLVKKELGTHIAAFCTILLQSSYYLANYFKIGYVNPQAFALFILSLYLTYLCGRSPRLKNFALLGGVLGLSFYIYLGPLFPFIAWPFLIPILSNRKFSKKIIARNMVISGTIYLIIMLPGIIDTAQLAGPASKTLFAREYKGSFQTLINIYHNFLLFYKSYDYLYNHFVAGPYLDIISRCLAFIGTIVCLTKIRISFYRSLILAYISTCIIIGITSPYAYTPTTRGIFFLPFGFVLSGIGLLFLQKKTGLTKISYIILPIIILLNIYQSQIGVFSPPIHTASALVIKNLQEASDNKPRTLLLSDKYVSNHTGLYLPLIQEAYNLETIPFEIITTSSLTCAALKEKGEIIVLADDKYAQQLLLELACPVKKDLTPTILHPRIYL